MLVGFFMNNLIRRLNEAGYDIEAVMVKLSTPDLDPVFTFILRSASFDDAPVHN